MLDRERFKQAIEASGEQQNRVSGRARREFEKYAELYHRMNLMAQDKLRLLKKRLKRT